MGSPTGEHTLSREGPVIMGLLTLGHTFVDTPRTLPFELYQNELKRVCFLTIRPNTKTKGNALANIVTMPNCNVSSKKSAFISLQECKQLIIPSPYYNNNLVQNFSCLSSYHQKVHHPSHLQRLQYKKASNILFPLEAYEAWIFHPDPSFHPFPY